MWKGAENWDGKNVNGKEAVQNKTWDQAQHIGFLYTECVYLDCLLFWKRHWNLILTPNTEDKISTETGTNFLFL